jgi:hypothetical protein
LNGNSRQIPLKSKYTNYIICCFEIENKMEDLTVLAPIAADILVAARRDKGGKRDIAPEKTLNLETFATL